MKTVLITGAASGIGAATKELFLKNGYQVIGLDIKHDLELGNYKHYQVDITSEESVKLLVDEFKKNNLMFDSIINIAGIHKMASFVDDDFCDLKKVIDINLLGPILINNKCHQFLKPQGKIIIVTSEVAGYDPLPFNGLYSVSKIALEQYAQALRQELNLLDQLVITIMPGSIKTPLQNNSINDTESLANRTSLYKNESRKFVQITKKFMGTPLEPANVARLILKVTNNHKCLTFFEFLRI